MRKSLLLLFAGALLCGGCRSLKQALNDEPKKKTSTAETRPAALRSSESEIFPGSHRHSRSPSPIAGDLTAQERAALDASLRDTHIPSRDMRQLDRENKAASDWVFGR